MSFIESKPTPCDVPDENGHCECPYAAIYTGYEDEMCRVCCGLGVDEDSYPKEDCPEETENDTDLNAGIAADPATRRRITVSKTVEALTQLYSFVGYMRNETVSVYVDEEDIKADREIITITIGKASYRVDVTCDSVPAIIKDVVDATILKI